MADQIERTRQREIERLENRYRRAVLILGRLFLRGLDFDRPSLFGPLGQANRVLDDLDEFTLRWARRNIVRIYDLRRRLTSREISGLGLARRSRQNLLAIRKRSLDSLTDDPSAGLVALLLLATQEIRSRLRRIYNQSRTLRAERRLGIAVSEVGALADRSAEEVQRELFRDLTREVSDQTLRPEFRSLPGENIFSNLANLTYVRFPTQKGDRFVRVEDYAKQLAESKTGQAGTLGMRHALLDNGTDLVQVSPHRSAQNDACDLYVGRVFAITEAAAREWNVRRVHELPNGGYPFHPNCTHPEVPYFPAFKVGEQISRDTSSPPEWALNTSWDAVNREYRRRGGIEFLNRTHPGFKILLTPEGRAQVERERRGERQKMREAREVNARS